MNESALTLQTFSDTYPRARKIKRLVRRETFNKRLGTNFSITKFCLSPIFVGMLFGGDKHIVPLLVTLVIIMSTLPNGFGADVGPNSQLKIANQNSAPASGESITAKMVQIRRLVKSLFSDWKLGESDFEGKIILDPSRA